MHCSWSRLQQNGMEIIQNPSTDRLHNLSFARQDLRFHPSIAAMGNQESSASVRWANQTELPMVRLTTSSQHSCVFSPQTSILTPYLP
jgi:hypothetical protein